MSHPSDNTAPLVFRGAPFVIALSSLKSMKMKTAVKKTISLFIFLLLIKTVFAQETIEVAADVCVLHLDKTNGNLVGLHWKNPGEEIIKESRLGENFRILYNGVRQAYRPETLKSKSLNSVLHSSILFSNSIIFFPPWVFLFNCTS